MTERTKFKFPGIGFHLVADKGGGVVSKNTNELKTVAVLGKESIQGTVKLRHSGPIRPQDVGNAVRSSPII